jgi:hypothetical protein
VLFRSLFHYRSIQIQFQDFYFQIFEVTLS